MKMFFIIFTLIVSSECGVLDDLLSSKEKSQDLNGLVNLKPKDPTETSKTQQQGVIIKVVETLKNGTKIVIDALGNIIHIHPNENEEDPKIKGTLESTTQPSIKYNGVATNMNASETKDPNTEKVKEAQNNATTSTNQTATEKEKDIQKLDENRNTTTPTEQQKIDPEITTEVPNVDHKLDDKNCTATDVKSCDNTTTLRKTAKSFLKGDRCPKGKDRADDGTCVDIE